MRRRMSELGAPQPDWAPVDSDDDLQAFLDAHGGAAILKTAKGGYDGKGVRRVTSVTDARDWIDAAVSGEGPQLLVEELVDFTRELSQQLARSIRGEIVSWPLVETVQRDSVCAEVYAPARAGAGDARKRAAEAAEIAHLIAEGVGVTGVMAVELFETADGRVLVNELAMRPTTPVTGPSKVDHQPVRAAPACRARPAARHRRHGAARCGHGQRARRALERPHGRRLRERPCSLPRRAFPLVREDREAWPQGRPRHRDRR